MPVRIRAIADPRFAAELTRLRTNSGLSLRDLARVVHHGKTYLHDLETGRTKPTGEVAQHLDNALQAGGTLAALVADIPPTCADSDQRLAYITANPTRLDAASVQLLADELAVLRRLDDTLPAPMMLPSAAPQWRAIQTLAKQVRGPHAAGLHAVAAEWTQFLGWLHAEARYDTEAVRLLGEAADQADAINDGPLAAQAANFLGYVARQRNSPRGIVRHFLAAYHTPGASTLQRVGDAIQAAHGYALLGDRTAAVRLLGDAGDLTTAAEKEVPPATAYWLSVPFSRLNLGLAYSALDDRTAAADNLRAGFTGLSVDLRDAQWTVEYQRVLAAVA